MNNHLILGDSWLGHVPVELLWINHNSRAVDNNKLNSTRWYSGILQSTIRDIPAYVVGRLTRGCRPRLNVELRRQGKDIPDRLPAVAHFLNVWTFVNSVVYWRGMSCEVNYKPDLEHVHCTDTHDKRKTRHRAQIKGIHNWICSIPTLLLISDSGRKIYDDVLPDSDNRWVENNCTYDHHTFHLSSRDV